MKLTELSKVQQERNLRRLTAFFNKYSRNWASNIMRDASRRQFPADFKEWEREYNELIFNSEPFFSMRQGNDEKYDEYLATYLEHSDELFNIVWQRLQRLGKFQTYDEQARNRKTS
jgi:hypothetical protein